MNQNAPLNMGKSEILDEIENLTFELSIETDKKERSNIIRAINELENALIRINKSNN